MSKRGDTLDPHDGCWLGGLLWHVGPIPLEAPWPWARLCIGRLGIDLGPSGVVSAITTVGTMPTLRLEWGGIELAEVVREPYPFGLMGGVQFHLKERGDAITFTRPTTAHGAAIRHILKELDRLGVAVDGNVRVILPWKG
jgi:hypothetical protein